MLMLNNKTKLILLALLGVLISNLVIYSNVVMYKVNVPGSGVTFIEAQRFWTKCLVAALLYLGLVDFNKWRLCPEFIQLSNLILTSRRLITANSVFLGFIAIPVLLDMSHLLSSPLTVSKSFPEYYWICVAMGILYFIYDSYRWLQLPPRPIEESKKKLFTFSNNLK